MGLWILLLLFKQQCPVKVVAAGLAHGKTVVASFIFTIDGQLLQHNMLKSSSLLHYIVFAHLSTGHIFMTLAGFSLLFYCSTNLSLCKYHTVLICILEYLNNSPNPKFNKNNCPNKRWEKTYEHTVHWREYTDDK